MSEAPHNGGEAFHTEDMTISMGPQHPSTHGVLRLLLKLDGEVILEDAETAKNLKTFVTRRMKKTYLDRLYDHIYRLKDDCDAINAKFISVTTNVPVFDTFYHILGKT